MRKRFPRHDFEGEMNMSHETTRTRRSMLVGLGAAAAVSAIAVKSAGAQTAAAFQPTRHPEDSWLDAPGAKHRIVIDAPTAHGAGEAILFANNLYEANKNAYKGTEKDLGIVIVLRHLGTPFGDQTHLGEVRQTDGDATGVQRSEDETAAHHEPLQLERVTAWSCRTSATPSTRSAASAATSDP